MLDDLRNPEDEGVQRLGDLAGPTIRKRWTGSNGPRLVTSPTTNTCTKCIAGMRRATAEVLADCFPAGMRETQYPMVEEMQEVLGRANDSHVAAALLGALRDQPRSRPALRDRLKPGVEALAVPPSAG
ncbi:MAG: hypothetical protein U0797_27970 [Gemmataceae bacterium]